MRIYPESISLYEGTGRISIKWVTTKRGMDETIKWFFIAPPNDIKKYNLVKDWVAKRPDLVERIRKELEDNGSLK